VRAIADLGIGIEELEDGEYKITSNTPEEIEYMIELGLLVKDEKTGKVTVTDNLQDVLDRGKQLDARQGRETKETHYVDRVERTWREYYSAGLHASTSGTSVGQHYRNAEGSFRAAADGFLSDQEAQIARGGSWLVWAEDETQGESFIPHAPAKRARATQIMAATADIFGLGLVDADGNRIARDGTPVGPLAGQVTTFADGGVRSAEELLAFAAGERVDGEQASRSLEGAPYVYGGVNWGDCSSTQGQLALFAAGRSGVTSARYMATANQESQLAALGFLPGLGGPGDFSIGWLNGGPGGGHTSGSIAGVNVEMGGTRGNGQIGGGAAPASHPQYTHHAHLPLSGGGLGEISSTSVNGYSYSSPGGGERSVNWGAASDLNQRARRYLGVYDQGGWLPSGGMAVNLGSKPEPVFSPPQWSLLQRAIDSLPALIDALRSGDTARARDVGAGMTAAVLADVEVQAKAADAAVLAFGESLGGEVVSKMPIVQDAERGLIETRKGLAEESAALVSQEREVLAAREHLAKVEAQGGEVSKATSRKLEDAERKLSEARADGKADKIADAERNLSRAREDAAEQMAKSEEQNAREVQQARETVAKAETDLAEMRELSETAAKRLEAAERTVIAARYQAIADLSMSVGESFAKAAGGARDLFAALADQARIMEETRQ
ncbi:MAG: hypothetical protein GX595_12300, partial [Lentisphaerae bacterium]|nr:hypothetical protein [Lentisphaerota bacterium]